MTTTVLESQYQILPAMSDDEFQRLKSDIRQNGVLEPLEFDTDGHILDGHHRFQAFSELIDEGVDLPMFEKIVRKFDNDAAKYAFIISVNVKRRHLTAEQRQELAVKLRQPPFSYTLSHIAELLSVTAITISRDFAKLPEEDHKALLEAPIVSANNKVFSGARVTSDLLYVTGHSQMQRLQAATAQQEAPNARMDRLEELQDKYHVSHGDVWELPSASVEGACHRIMCGSCLSHDDLDILMHPERARLVITSPPYNQNISNFKPSGMQSEALGFTNRMADAYFDELPESGYQTQQIAMLNLMYEFSTDDASFFYNHKNRYRESHVISPVIWITDGDSRWEWRSEIVWDRSSSITVNARMFIPADERIYWLWKGKEFYFADTTEVKSWTTVWRIAAHNEENVSAPFANEIPHRCIIACSERGDIVLDPYSGSGTTIAEAERAGRIGYGMEINPAYVAVTLERLANMRLTPKKVS